MFPDTHRLNNAKKPSRDLTNFQKLNQRWDLVTAVAKSFFEPLKIDHIQRLHSLDSFFLRAHDMWAWGAKPIFAHEFGSIHIPIQYQISCYWFEIFYIFHILGMIIPFHITWLIFFRGVETTNQICILLFWREQNVLWCVATLRDWWAELHCLVVYMCRCLKFFSSPSICPIETDFGDKSASRD